MSENSSQTTSAVKTQQVEITPVEEVYAKRKKIYPRQVTGIFARLRFIGVLVLLGVYYLGPMLQWDGRQAILFDLPARKFYIFDWIFWPQDFIYLAALLIIAALGLFLVTALAGRVWCGYACPQTVWTEVFLWIERKVEGDRPKQMKLDKSDFSWKKFRLKFTKHFLWLAFSLYTGFVFVGWFTPMSELIDSTINFELGPWETFWIIFYGFATYGNAGWMREQVCLYMCPYARFQSAMFDKNTLVISYDEKRGEPRGSRKKDVDFTEQGLGSCIDCTLCVQVCPTGIDIRDGLQYQCIGCAACVDVCNEVMDKMGYPRNLISYTTENALMGGKESLFRPRVVVYLVLLFVITTALLTSVAQRVPLGLDIIRDRSALYRETDEGMIENIYTLKVMNMDLKPHRYSLAVGGIDGLIVTKPNEGIVVEAGGVANYPIRIRADPDKLNAASTELIFYLNAIDDDGLAVEEDGRFLGPVFK